jgi:hypothetical protein
MAGVSLGLSPTADCIEVFQAKADWIDFAVTVRALRFLLMREDTFLW